MAKYLIRTCPRRLWYVKDHLIPSMIAQGIKKSDISVYNDENGDGCLESCMKVFENAPDDENGIWYMQDDVVISSKFRELTEKHDSGIVCGHCYALHSDRRDEVGFVDVSRMWFSFPCIRIPNRIARGCADYFRREIAKDPQYEHWIRAKRYDDTIFSIYVTFYHSREQILNLVPNIVAHVDYLIGGTAANETTRKVDNPYFDEPERIAELKEKLKC